MHNAVCIVNRHLSPSCRGIVKLTINGLLTIHRKTRRIRLQFRFEGDTLVKLRIGLVVVLAQLGQVALLQAQQTNREHWVATWVTAQNIVRNPPPAARPPAPATASAAPAATAPAYSSSRSP